MKKSVIFWLVFGGQIVFLSLLFAYTAFGQTPMPTLSWVNKSDSVPVQTASWFSITGVQNNTLDWFSLYTPSIDIAAVGSGYAVTYFSNCQTFGTSPGNLGKCLTASTTYSVIFNSGTDPVEGDWGEATHTSSNGWHKYDFDIDIVTGSNDQIVIDAPSCPNLSVGDPFFYNTNDIEPNLSTTRLRTACSGTSQVTDYGKMGVIFSTNQVATPYVEVPETLECATGNIFSDGLCSVLVWAFYPSGKSLQNFRTLQTDLEHKPPFGYASAIFEAVGDINASDTPAFSIEGASLSIFDDLRTILAISLWFLFGFALYRRFKYFDL